MSHRQRLADVVQSVLRDVGLTAAYEVDVYRGFALDDWRVRLEPVRHDVPFLELRFTIGDAPDWTAIADEVKDRLQPRRHG